MSVEKDKIYSTDKPKSPRGRKPGSGNVRIEPVFRKEIDIEKLGRAIIAMAVHEVKKEMESKSNDQPSEEDV
jgi:hypothetical protein